MLYSPQYKDISFFLDICLSTTLYLWPSVLKTLNETKSAIYTTH